MVFAVGSLLQLALVTTSPRLPYLILDVTNKRAGRERFVMPAGFLLSKSGVANISEKIREARLIWVGQMERKTEDGGEVKLWLGSS